MAENNEPVVSTETKPVETAAVNTETKTTTTPVVDEFENPYAKYKTLGVGDSITIPPPKVEDKADDGATPPPPVTETSSLKTETTPVNVETQPKVIEIEEFDEISPETIFEQLDKKANELGFKSFEDVKTFKSIDYSNHTDGGVTETETIEDWMRFKDPRISDAEIDLALNKFAPLFLNEEEQKALITEGKLSDEKILELNAEFNKQLRTAEDELSAEQNKIDLKQLTIKHKKTTEPTKNNVEPTAEAKEQLKQTIETFSKTFNEDIFQAKDKEGKVVDEVKFTITPEQHQANVTSAVDAFKRWINDDGSLNVKKFYAEINTLNNREKIYSEIYKQAYEKGTEAQVKEISNIKFGEGQSPHTPITKKSLADVILGGG